MECLEVAQVLRGVVPFVPNDFVDLDVEEFVRVVVVAVAAVLHSSDVLKEVVQLNVDYNRFDLIVRDHN